MKNIFEARSKPIEFTPGQTEALKKVETFLKSQDHFFLLAGYSGCGKTTIAENIAKFSNAHMMAPTNAAVNRLSEKIDAAQSKFSTIHRVMYSPKDDKGNFRKAKGLETGKTYIVDECSMIDKKILNDLTTDATERNCKIIFMGDSFQLEPVGEDPHLFSWLGEHFHDRNRHELTEVKRYDGDLLKIATELRINKEACFKGIDSDDLIVVPKFTKELLKDIKNDNDYVVLTSTNQKRVIYNKKIRAARFNSVENLKYAQNNDRLVSVSNNNHYSNGETFKITYPQLVHSFDIRIFIEKTEELKVYSALLYKSKGRVILLIPSLLEPSLHGVQIFNALEDNLFSLTPEVYKMLIVDIERMRLRFWNKDVIIATYGYAISCHKAQGQEWDNVYIDAEWLMPVWDSARWFYTAITRAKKKVQVTENKYLTIV